MSTTNHTDRIYVKECCRKVIFNTTYIVQIHYSVTEKETLEQKIKRLLQEEAQIT